MAQVTIGAAPPAIETTPAVADGVVVPVIELLVRFRARVWAPVTALVDRIARRES
jgi:hypothetical protein